ncbi:MAG: aminotransferase class V-fold PLP-dependent enzyme [Planctomycetes bacterium]|nr:aminotransferase class V-fold PLP-dependent enzyme [Planctomycetota bacterium]
MDWNALRDEFPITRNYNFMNHATVAPLSKRAADGIRRYVDHAEQNSYVRGGFFKKVEQVRGMVGSLINANSDEIAFTKGTSEGLCFVANGLTWQNGDNIVTCNAEFGAKDTAKPSLMGDFNVVPPGIPVDLTRVMSPESTPAPVSTTRASRVRRVLLV